MEYNTKQYLFSANTAATGEEDKEVQIRVNFSHHTEGGRSRSKGLSIIKSTSFQLSENNKSIQTEYYLMQRLWWDLVMVDAYLSNSSAGCLWNIKGGGTKKRSKKAWGPKRTWRQSICNNLSIYREAQTVVFTYFKSKGSQIISHGSDTKFFRGLWHWHCEFSKSYHPFSCQYLNSWIRVLQTK